MFTAAIALGVTAFVLVAIGMTLHIRLVALLAKGSVPTPGRTVSGMLIAFAGTMIGAIAVILAIIGLILLFV